MNLDEFTHEIKRGERAQKFDFVGAAAGLATGITIQITCRIFFLYAPLLVVGLMYAGRGIAKLIHLKTWK